MPSFTHQGRVAFHETDAAGIAHFSSFFLYAEEAETAALASLGIFDAHTLAHYAFPRVQANARYSHPLRFFDSYEVQASISHIGESSLAWHFDICCEGRCCASVDIVSVRLCAEHGTRAPYSEQEKRALETLMQPPPTPPGDTTPHACE